MGMAWRDAALLIQRVVDRVEGPFFPLASQEEEQCFDKLSTNGFGDGADLAA
jgi:hypothetical protein